MNSLSRIPQKNLGPLPFHWGTPKTPYGSKLPIELNFSLRFNSQTGVLEQTPDKEVESAIDLVYRQGSYISGFMEDQGIGEKYTADFLEFIKETHRVSDFEGLRVLDIGCGTGYLLSKIQDEGGEVLGIDPDPQAKTRSQKYNVPIVHDFFPSPEIHGKFDIILFYNYLEHVQDIISFIDFKNISHLKTQVIFAVPDCEPYLKTGDTSILFHKHWQYFTKTSLLYFIQTVGSQKITIQKSNFGGSLYCSGFFPNLKQIHNKSLFKKSQDEIQRYYHLLPITLEKIKALFDLWKSQHHVIGIYCPARIINALKILNISTKDVFFYDDNPNIYGKYFPGINIAILNKADLLRNPPDQLLIMSSSFGEIIRAKVKNALQPKTQITLWSEFFGP